MKIGVLGTGMVGNAIGSKLVQLGYEVKMGSRTANNEKATEWAEKAGEKASHDTFEDAAKFGEIIFNCTNGMNSLNALEQAGKENLAGKILIDIANPLDFSKGMPPSLSVCNTDSLGEQIQRAFPETKVVKTLNTMNCYLMVDATIVPGEHDIFVSGNDEAAKTTVTEMLKKDFGWKEPIDLGDITNARATEMLLPIWVRLYGKYQSPMFNFKIVK
ncbi:MAG: NADPH-dependent F420 reductase [Bacteroidia bacterium]